MKKPVHWMTAVLTAAALTVMTALPAAAEWQPSRVQQEVGVVSATALRPDGGTAALQITTEPVYTQDGAVLDFKTTRQPYIKVTPVSHTIAANLGFNEQEDNALLTYGEKAGRTTGTGLTYAVNADTNLVYTAVTRADSTTAFLDKMNGTLRGLFEQRVAEQNQAVQTALSEQKAALEQQIRELTGQGKEQQTAALQAQADTLDGQIEAAGAVTAQDYAPMSLFDITASAGALEKMGENGRVRLELEIPGVSPEGQYIVIHFLGAPEDPEALQNALEQDFARTMLDYDAELLESVPGDGTLTIEMEQFSPVLVMARVEPAAAQEPQQPAAPVEDAAGPAQESAGRSGWLWLLALVPAAGIAAAVLRRRKVTAGK